MGKGRRSRPKGRTDGQAWRSDKQGGADQQGRGEGVQEEARQDKQEGGGAGKDKRR